MLTASAEHSRRDGAGAVTAMSAPGGWDPPNAVQLAAAVAPPPLDPHFYIAPDDLAVLRAALKRAEREGAVNVLLVGDPGSGKSSLPRQLAALWRRPFFAFHCGSLRQVTDYWGIRELEGDRTVFYPSALTHALSIGGAIVVLEEINRAPCHLLNPVLPLLDSQRQTYLDALQKYVVVGPGTLIFGTANLGSGFAGTFPLDEALRDRFATTLRLDPPAPEKVAEIVVAKTGCSREQAGKIVRIAEAVNALARGTGAASSISRKVGMRALLEVAHWLACGVSFGHACRLAISDSYSAEGDESSERFQVEQIILGILGPREFKR